MSNNGGAERVDYTNVSDVDYHNFSSGGASSSSSGGSGSSSLEDETERVIGELYQCFNTEIPLEKIRRVCYEMGSSKERAKEKLERMFRDNSSPEVLHGL